MLGSALAPNVPALWGKCFPSSAVVGGGGGEAAAAALPLPSLLTRFRVTVACGFINWERHSELAAPRRENVFTSLPDFFWKSTRELMIMRASFSNLNGQMHLIY